MLILLLSLAIFGWYFLTVDIEQFVVSAAVQGGTPMPPEALSAVTEQADLIRLVTLISATVTQVGLPFLIALYCSLISNTVSEERSTFGQWLAVATWSALPALIIGMLSMSVSMIIAQDAFVTIEALDRTTLNNLALHLAPQDPGYFLANAISIGSLWSWLVSVLGFSIVAKTSRRTAAIVMAAPLVVITLLTWFL